jgi:hypothetical protein
LRDIEVTVDRATESGSHRPGRQGGPAQPGGTSAPRPMPSKTCTTIPRCSPDPIMRRGGRLQAGELVGRGARSSPRGGSPKSGVIMGPTAIASYFGTGLTHVPGLALYAPLLLTTLGFQPGLLRVERGQPCPFHGHGDPCLAASPPCRSPTSTTERLFRRDRRQPAPVQRQLHDGPGRPAPPARRSRREGARSWSSTRAAPRRLKMADSAPCRFHPGSDAVLLLAGANHVLFRQRARTNLAPPGGLRGRTSTSCAVIADALHRRRVASPACGIPAADIRIGSHASWPPRRAPASTGGSARRCSSSARSPTG